MNSNQKDKNNFPRNLNAWRKSKVRKANIQPSQGRRLLMFSGGIEKKHGAAMG